MENRPDAFEPPLYEIDKRVAQVEKSLEIQLKPAAQWLKHIECLCNEVDDTVSIILSSEQEQIHRKPHKQFSNLSNDLPPSSKSASGKLISGNLSPTIAQFQDLASKAQKELYGLKSQIQKDASMMNVKQP